jgi:glucosamine-6-phosphate deaminase
MSGKNFQNALTNRIQMEVIIQPNANAAADLTARLIATELRAKPALTLGLATGRTMESVYALLVKMHREGNLDFSQCHTFNLDEYIGFAGDNPNSYRYYMNRHLFSQVNIDLANTHLPNGATADIETECKRYEWLITQRGGIGLQLLGIGHDGHIGFNEPLSSWRSRTRVKALSPVTRRENASQFSKPEDMPRRAITMGIGTILDARRCLMLATGADKADIVARAIEGPMTAMVSASALQLHPQCVIIVDEAAAAKLARADYYREIFETEPEWEPFRK